MKPRGTTSFVNLARIQPNSAEFRGFGPPDVVPSIYVVQWRMTKVPKSHVNQIAVKRTSVTKASITAHRRPTILRVSQRCGPTWLITRNLIGLGVGSPIVSAKWSQCNFKFAEFGGNVPGNTCNLCGKW